MIPQRMPVITWEENVRGFPNENRKKKHRKMIPIRKIQLKFLEHIMIKDDLQILKLIGCTESIKNRSSSE